MSTGLMETNVVGLLASAHTADELLTMPDGDLFELIDGQLVERDMGETSSWVAGEIYGWLRDFNRDQPQAWVFPEGSSFQCFPDDPQRTRRADAAVIRFGRLPNRKLSKGHTRIAPDLAVEVVSPNDLFHEVETKVGDWHSAGVRLVWVVEPDNRTVTIHRRGTSQVTRLQGDEEITGEDVLPGFRCRISEFFPPDSEGGLDQKSPSDGSEPPAAP